MIRVKAVDGCIATVTPQNANHQMTRVATHTLSDDYKAKSCCVTVELTGVAHFTHLYGINKHAVRSD